jgi:hypothetical protein
MSPCVCVYDSYVLSTRPYVMRIQHKTRVDTEAFPTHTIYTCNIL